MPLQILIYDGTHAGSRIGRVTGPGMVGIIQARWSKLGHIEQHMRRIKLPGRPAHLILRHVVQEIEHQLVGILHGGPFTADGDGRIGQERPLAKINGGLAFEVTQP